MLYGAVQVGTAGNSVPEPFTVRPSGGLRADRGGLGRAWIVLQSHGRSGDMLRLRIGGGMCNYMVFSQK